MPIILFCRLSYGPYEHYSQDRQPEDKELGVGKQKLGHRDHRVFIGHTCTFLSLSRYGLRVATSYCWVASTRADLSRVHIWAFAPYEHANRWSGAYDEEPCEQWAAICGPNTEFIRKPFTLIVRQESAPKPVYTEHVPNTVFTLKYPHTRLGPRHIG